MAKLKSDWLLRITTKLFYLGQFDASAVQKRVSENDEITIYGTSSGIISYDSTMGGKISIPGVAIDKIDQ